MAAIIEISYTPGSSVYAVIHNPDGTVWRADTNVWETFSAANWDKYAVPLDEQGSTGYYTAPFPADISGVLTTEAVYLRQGASPAISDAPPISLGASQGVNVVQVSGDTQAAVAQAAALDTVVLGTVTTGVSASSVVATLPSSQDNAYNGRVVVFRTGLLTGQAGTIHSYAVGTGVLVFDAMSLVPTAGDKFVIV